MILWQVLIEEDPDVPGYVEVSPKRIENKDLIEPELTAPTPAEELVLTQIDEYTEAALRGDTFLVTANEN